jgi:CheY-like chemotaxis protein
MTDHRLTRIKEEPPEAFVKQVKEALENLYDFPYLLRHPLAQEGDPTTEHSIEAGARRLRRDLIAAIEALNPGADVSSQTPQARIYNLLVLHYVEGRTVQEAAHEMDISQRQAHRNLRQGEERVAAVLWGRRPTTSPQEPKATQLSSVQEEMARLVTQSCPTDACALLERAQDAVLQQAAQRAVAFETECSQKPLAISTDPALAQQVLINALSHIVRQAQAGTLHLALRTDEKQISLTLRYIPEPESAHTPAISNVVKQLADRLGWTVKQEDQPGNARTVRLLMTPRCPTVLVIDDNEGLVKLLDSYLTGQACQVISAASGPEGLGLAQEQGPDAIVLDVMIPGMDGWEVLQRLRNHP